MTETNYDRLSDEHLRTMHRNLQTIDAADPLFRRDIDVCSGSKGVVFDLPPLIRLAQMAVTYSDWTTLGQLPNGVFFERDNGVRGVRCFERSGGIIACALGGSGEIPNLSPNIKVRQVIMPYPRKESEPPSLEERAWRYIEGLAEGAELEGAKNLLAEKRALETP